MIIMIIIIIIIISSSIIIIQQKENGPRPKWQNIKLLMVLTTNHWSGNKQELNT